LKKWLENRAHW